MIDAQFIKNKAKELGFIACGISKARKLEEEEQKLSNWLKNGYQGKMQYLENHFEKRLDPTLLVPGARSVISLIYNYFPEKTQSNTQFKVAKYAYGKDYHFVIKNKLRQLEQHIKDQIGAVEGRFFVDSAPVMERQWAQLAGLGWIGKNGLLLRKQKGSFFFIAQYICDLELQYQKVVTTNHCGTCTACIDSCPTQAIVLPQVIDSNKCISYLTIELKENIPLEFKPQMQNWVYGCDICQDVCPWNKFSAPHTENDFVPKKYINWNNKDWVKLNEEIFNLEFSQTALKRIKINKLKENIHFLNSK